jgi:hypothetical protein
MTPENGKGGDMRRTGIRGVVGLLILLLVIVSIGLTDATGGTEDYRGAEDTSGDDGDSDSGPVDFA